MSHTNKILIIGAGFAGVWAALAAMRHCKLLKKEKKFDITVINKDNYHGLRPRFYEENLEPTRISLDKVLTPYGIKHSIGEVTLIDHARQKVDLKTESSELEIHDYDRLILASGSHLHSPPVPGLNKFGYNVDTYEAAHRLGKHLHALHKKPAKGRYTLVVVGGGFTGLEAATDLISRMRKLAGDPKEGRVIIIDHAEIGHTLGKESQLVAQKALRDLGIETKMNVHVSSILEDHIILDNGEIIDTQTVVWTAGMRANTLTKMFPCELDHLGRIAVDKFLKINEVKNCFAAGDVAVAMTDETHPSLLQCQHAMPQGRWAGHNAVADIMGEPLVPYEQRKYVSIIDLGAWGAVYAEGWEGKIISQGEAAREIKHYINHQRISPLVDGNVEELMEAAEPVFKAIPLTEGKGQYG